MNASAPSLAERLAGHPWTRTIAGLGLQTWAARRVAQLDRLDPAEAQQQLLRRLLRQARDTKFGREHGFAQIRSVRDYQTRVPLRDYEAFWTQYFAPAFPHFDHVTWPGPIPYLALSSGTTSGATKYIPVSREMLASNRQAALTSLAWFVNAHPQARPFAGRMLFLGGSTDLRPVANGSTIRAGDLSGIAAVEIPQALRAYTYPPLEVALLDDWDAKLERLAQGSLHEAITMVSGVPSWLLVLFERLRQLSGRETLAEIWPTLQCVIHGGTKMDPYRTLFRQALGREQIQLLETYPASEGFIASQDHRHSGPTHLLRLIPDHGVFFEFVPVEELSQPLPRRHTLAEIETGVQYAVVLTTCAGLWSYVIGDTVCFESRDPPLLRFTGRTRYFLSAFGEHLISEELERAVATAAESHGVAVTDFHVGPQFPESAAEVGRHVYFVEFSGDAPRAVEQFARSLDATLSDLNADYRAHRQGDLTLRPPLVRVAPRGSFVEWMRARGKVGGQHKTPRVDNSGQLTQQLADWLASRSHAVAGPT